MKSVYQKSLRNKAIYEGEAWIRLTLNHGENGTMLLEVRPDASKGIVKWGPVSAPARRRKRR